MRAESDETALDAELADLLDELSSVQSELLQVLEAKRDCMASNNLDEMTSLHPRAEELCDRLKACHDRRTRLLSSAESQGLGSDTLRQLATKLPGGSERRSSRQVNAASAKMRLLQHHSLTNWVLAQRTILHLSQLLEIVATGGQLQPTYSRDESSASPGALVDREV